MNENTVHQLLKVQVNLFQKHFFLHQLTNNMTKDCSLNCKFNTFKLQAQNTLRTYSEHVVYINCSECQNKNNLCTQHVLSLEFSCIGNSMNNLLSYYGLVDARISASEKDLPVQFTN